MQAKKALVTGSSNGIGEAIVKKLAQLDYKLVITGRNADDIRRVAAECAALSPSKWQPLEVVADLSDEDQVEELFRKSVDFFQGTLHLLVNNAGVCGQPVAHTKPIECYLNYKKIMQINQNATVRLTLLAAEHLKRGAEESGRSTCVINIGSIAAFRPSLTLAAYATSKAAMSMFSQCMAVELAPKVRVNCVCPGPIETKIIERSGVPLQEFKRFAGQEAPLSRVGQAHEVASSVLFLANPEEAAFITGATLIVDGGTILAPLGMMQD